jgi:hypothetical protein
MIPAAPGLLKELRGRSPKDEKGRRDLLHLWLSEDVGDPMLVHAHDVPAAGNRERPRMGPVLAHGRSGFEAIPWPLAFGETENLEDEAAN